MRHHYLELLKNDEHAHARASALLERTSEIMLFLTERLRVDLTSHLASSAPTTWHWPCHARAIYSPKQLHAWLSGPGAACTPPARPDLCCGFGGSFAIDFPGVSLAMMDDKLADLTATGANQVICNEGGCALHLAGGAHRRGLPLRFKHAIERLAESLGLMEPVP
jgi:L-lactate dehydrogenase complex protein LldE